MDFRPMSTGYWELYAKSMKIDANYYNYLIEITVLPLVCEFTSNVDGFVSSQTGLAV